MKSTDAVLLIVPGWKGSDPDHWQSRWARSLSSARKVEQDDWHRPDPVAWPRRVAEAVAVAEKPVVVVAHSLGVPTLIHAVPLLPEGKVRGAFLVAAPDLDRPGLDPVLAGFAPVPTAPLPFPAVLVASRTDPYCSYERAEGFALDWGAAIVDAGEAGHINSDAGFGPWPEGSMRLLGLLQSLK